MYEKVNDTNILFLFTSEFPFGKGETFIENEIYFLSKSFNKVIIICGGDKTPNQRPIQQNVEIKTIKYDYNFSFLDLAKSVFSHRLILEFMLLLFFYKKKPKFGRIKTIINSNANSFRLNKLYLDVVESFDLHAKKYLYSFWFNDSTHALGLMKKNNPKLKVFSRTHRWDLYFNQNKYNYLPFRFQTSKYIDFIYSASNEGIQYCKNNWKISKYNNLRLSRLGVNRQKLLPLDVSKKIIVSCSNIIPVKRVDKIIKSLALTKTRNIKWVHFGTGKNDSEIKALALKLLDGKVDFKFMGRVGNNALLDWYKKNNPDLFINLSYSEGIPVSIMEAMSFGIPCIASKAGGCLELVTNSVGFPVSIDASYKKIADLIDNFFNLTPQKKKKIRKSAHAHILDYFDSTKNYIDFCESLKTA